MNLDIIKKKESKWANGGISVFNLFHKHGEDLVLLLYWQVYLIAR